MSREGEMPTSKVLAGRFDRKLGRDRMLTIPAEWMACLGESRFVLVMPDPHERCLNIMPSSLMESEMARVRSNVQNGNDKEALNALRVIATVCERLEMDRRHRIRISDNLLDYAGIADRAVLLGEVRSIKVRSPEAMEIWHGGSQK